MPHQTPSWYTCVRFTTAYPGTTDCAILAQTYACPCLFERVRVRVHVDVGVVLSSGVVRAQKAPEPPLRTPCCQTYTVRAKTLPHCTHRKCTTLNQIQTVPNKTIHRYTIEQKSARAASLRHTSKVGIKCIPGTLRTDGAVFAFPSEGREQYLVDQGPRRHVLGPPHGHLLRLVPPYAASAPGRVS
eukprot:3554564-Rhodomonas_salina.2